MRKNRSSMTALGITIARAVESERPVDELVCYDPFARQFIPTWLLSLMVFIVRSGYAEWRGPGVMGYLTTRERYIDDFLIESAKCGLQQLVILGAGYDSRAYRFKDLLSGAKIFEVDHPATQGEKLRKLKKIFPRATEQVVFVPIDFNAQSLEPCLREAGYNPALKTLFIWQGVTMYLTCEAVEATLAFVRDHSAPGSRIIFDYMEQSLLDKSQTHAEVKNMRRYQFMTGEGLIFGIETGKAEEFLKLHGFREPKAVGAEELKGLYFTGKLAHRRVAAGYGIVAGVV